MASHGVFFLIQGIKAFSFVRQFVSIESFKYIARIIVTLIVMSFILGLIFLILTGKTQWSGRSMTLLDPTYAKKYIPIIASVSEH